ncbi:MAG: cadherin-like domain-containing protein, partial [Acidimicrobiia bacterium]|nr:cadherin-like domain-containing protein [Acidimicrobiia bacterium]
GSPTPFSLTLNATDSDVPAQTLTWSISSPASNGTATASGSGGTKAIGYTPNANYNGPDSFVVQVSDGNGGTDTITVNVTVEAVNDPPTVTSPGAQAATVGVLFSVDVVAGDIDGTVTAMTATGAGGGALPAWLTPSFDAPSETLTLSGTPGAGDVGPVTIEVTATDNLGASSSPVTSFVITVT